MIKTKYVEVKIINHNIKHYRDLDYDVKYNDIITVPPEHLSIGSHVKIEVECQECFTLKIVKYQDYYKTIKKHKYYSCNKCKGKQKKFCIENYGVDNISQLDTIKEKKIETTIKNYGVENPFQNEEIKEKIKKTNLEKYGVEYATKNKDIQLKSKNTRIKNNNQISDELLNKLEIYYRDVKIHTYKNKQLLLETWSGYDYYDGEYIIKYFSLESSNIKYPTFDHKISVYYGFMNNITAFDISKLENLCLTKRSHNSSKGKKNEDEYKKLIYTSLKK